jgi:hypothetical protein
MTAFFGTCFRFVEGAKIPKWIVYVAWKWWCEKSGHWELLERYSTPSLVTRGLGTELVDWTGEERKPHGANEYFVGVQLVENESLIKALAAAAKVKGKPWPDPEMKEVR